MFTVHTKKIRGFTLVEILIVTAIIATLALLAVINFLRTRVDSNESSAKASMRSYAGGIEQYRAAQIVPAYPPNLNALITSNPPFVDPVLGAGTKQGYVFTYNLVNQNQYTITGTPVTTGITGVNTFFVDETGVVRLNNAGGNPIQ